MLKEIIKELKHHAPFTFLGAASGIIVMLIFQNIPYKVSHNIFYTLHPLHVVLSAIATTSMYKLHTSGKSKLLYVILIGYIGSIGIATLSDSIIPYIGEFFLNLPHKEAHIGFIEKWWLINPLAFMAIAIAIFRPKTKFTHYGHVFLSTYASLFHITMATGGCLGCLSYIVILMFIFLSVLIPCCLSDIIFPLLFVKK